MNDHIQFYQNKLNYEIDSWDLSEALKGGDNIVVIDARSTAAYNIEHIPTAVSFPHRTMNMETTEHLNKEAIYVTYCDGIGCNASTKGALALAKLGFKVKELIGGIDWWKKDKYPTSSVASVESGSCGCS